MAVRGCDASAVSRDVGSGIYRLEQERIFRGPVWHYLCLEADLPEPGSFRTTYIGETPIIVTRNKDGAIHAFVNRCAHKGAQLCLEPCGKRQAFQEDPGPGMVVVKDSRRAEMLLAIPL